MKSTLENNNQKSKTNNRYYNMLKTNKYRNVRSRYLTSKTSTSTNNSYTMDSKQFKNMSLKELGDEFYRLAIKNRDDIIYELHKEICNKYEETQIAQYKTINDLQDDCKAMREKINNDNIRINNIVEDSDDQISELEKKYTDSNKEIAKLNNKLETLIKRDIESMRHTKLLEEERDEFKITVHALKGTIEELKTANLNLTNNLRYQIHYDSLNNDTFDTLDITNQLSLKQIGTRKSLARDLEEAECNNSHSIINISDNNLLSQQIDEDNTSKTKNSSMNPEPKTIDKKKQCDKTKANEVDEEPEGCLETNDKEEEGEKGKKKRKKEREEREEGEIYFLLSF
uniref:Uncharacterized protein n=1 Tax=Cacopsylla melanoneura TaxID=428564 RepID=A0A8D9E7S7_9HEMI